MSDPASNRKIEFVDRHEPPLEDGHYILKLEQEVQHDGQPLERFTAADRLFYVSGERYALAPEEILAVFPPADSDGDHANVLPHIVIGRNTLPWERSAQRKSGDGKALAKRRTIPWLALLLFDETETIETRVVQAGELPAHARLKEIGYRADERVRILEADRSLLEYLLPANTDELRLLVHSRQWTDESGAALGGDRAVIMASRLPRAGASSIVHLVSLENLYTTDGGPDLGTSQKAQLVSLKSWRFHCQQEANFLWLVQHLDRDVMRLPRNGGKAQHDPWTTQGFTPRRHDLRNGAKTASWYRGPLVGRHHDGADLSLPVLGAEALIRYDAGHDMLDMSLASAWQIGRLMALRNKRFSSDFFAWKRAHARHLANLEKRLVDLPLETHSSLPELPMELGRWLYDLALLKDVPFAYLVPDEAMLPRESVRLFALDRLWIECLLDGACSVGRVIAYDRAKDADHYDAGRTPLAMARADGDRAPIDAASGILLRSQLVSGWPDLKVDAFGRLACDAQTLPQSLGGRDSIANQADLRQALATHGIFPTDRYTIEAVATDSLNAKANGWQILDETDRLAEKVLMDGNEIFVRLTELRHDRLSKNVLICLFAGKPDLVDIHLKAEAVHFGLDHRNEAPTSMCANAGPLLTKKKRNLQTGEAKTIPVSLKQPLPSSDEFPQATDHRLDVVNLAQHLTDQGTTSSANFALAMVEGVERVRMRIAAVAT